MVKSLYVGILFSFSLYAGQTITIKPGGDIILEALSERTQIKCEGTSTITKYHCKCLQVSGRHLYGISHEDLGQLTLPDSFNSLPECNAYLLKHFVTTCVY